MAEEEINFDAEESKASEHQEAELGMDDFKGGNFIKIKPVGEELILEVDKIINNKNTKGKNNTTGVMFDIGLKDKNGMVRRYDIHTKDGIFTVNSWEVFFKLFKQPDGLLIKYAKEHDKKFKGAKVSLKRNYNGNHATMDCNDLAKIRSCSVDEAKEYQNTIKKAMKDKTLYDVKLV